MLKMKEVERYITLGISKKVSALVYNELFELLNNEEDSSDLQKFKLTTASNGVQLIEQTEEGNDKRKVHLLLTLESTKEKIVVLRDGMDITMMLEIEANRLLKKKKTGLKLVANNDQSQ